MKKTFMYFMTIAVAMILGLSSCSKDAPVLPIEQDLAGSYKGELGISINGTAIAGGIPQKVYISKSTSGDNQLKLELKSFSFGAMNLGDIQVDPCPVIEENGTYTFTGIQTLTLADPIGTCPVTVTGKIDNAGKISIDITVKVAALQQDVLAKFSGSKLSGNENKESKIISYTLANVFVTEQPVIDETKGTITFKVSDVAKDNDLKALTPTIAISDKAVISPASGIAQDFSAGQSVAYTVIAEDGTVKKYTVFVAGTQNVITHSFEEWTTGEMYPDIPVPIGWATCNDAVALIKNMGSFAGITYEGGYPVLPTTDHVSAEKALLMESVDTKGGNLLGQNVPKVTAGTAFLGSFNAFLAMQNPMATTSFGVMYDKKPIKVTGNYKYVAGADFYNEKGEKIDKKDECSLAAVLYEVNDDKETLDGSNLYTSDKIIAQAMFNNGGQAVYTPFTLTLEYKKAYDASKKYKLAVIFSASKDGAAYKGAVGSKLYIDDVAIIGE